jgi:hypothetical protein
MANDALRSVAQWHAIAKYRTDAGTLDVEMYLEEIGDLHDRIERGAHWDTIELIEIRRINHIDGPTLTLSQAEDLGKRKYKANVA